MTDRYALALAEATSGAIVAAVAAWAMPGWEGWLAGATAVLMGSYAAWVTWPR